MLNKKVKNIKKKAQMSIFLIIAVIIVIGGILLITFNSDINSNVKIFSDEKIDYRVTQFVESCILSETKKAQKEIGKSGGWLYYPNTNKFTDRKLLNSYNKEAVGLNVLEQKKITYLYYFDDLNNEFVYNVPDFDTDNTYSIRNQIKRYLSDNINNNCLNNFQVFKNLYDVDYDKEELKNNFIVKFDSDKIDVSLDFDVKITDRNSKQVKYVNQFKTTTENKIKTPYYLATDIVNSELKNAFVEEMILKIITPYQSVENKNLLPPFLSTELVADYGIWNLFEVEKLTKNIISSNIGDVQFKNTKYLEYDIPKNLQNSEFANGLKKSFLKDYLSETSTTKIENSNIFNDYKNYYVTPIYNSFFPMYFEIENAKGSKILKPEVRQLVDIPLLPFYKTDYSASYNMVTPIMFKIDSVNENNRYDFEFVIETNIYNNKPLIKSEADYFNSKKTKNNIKNYDMSDSLICDYNQRISKNISFEVYDAITGNDLDNYDIDFICKGIAKCSVGDQIYFDGNKNSKIKNIKLPVNCDPGSLKFSQNGYKSSYVFDLNPNLNSEIDLGKIELLSKKELDFRMNIVGAVDKSFKRSLENEEKVVLLFQDLENPDSMEVVNLKNYDLKNKKINLGVGVYNVTGYIIYDGEFTIKGKEICSEGSVFVKKKCTTVEDINMTTWISGGFTYSDFRVTKDGLIKNNAILVDFINYKIPKTFDELESSSKLIEEVEKYSTKPKLFELIKK